MYSNKRIKKNYGAKNGDEVFEMVYNPYEQYSMLALLQAELRPVTVEAVATDYSAWMKGAVLKGLTFPCLYAMCSMFIEGTHWLKAKSDFSLSDIPLYSRGRMPIVNVIVPEDIKYLGDTSKIINARLYFMKDFSSAGTGDVLAYREQSQMLQEIKGDNANAFMAYSCAEPVLLYGLLPVIIKMRNSDERCG